LISDIVTVKLVSHTLQQSNCGPLTRTRPQRRLLHSWRMSTVAK